MFIGCTFQIIIVFFDIIILTIASTHWIVTENGRIQSQIDSVYRMNKPYDLIEFLKQEERAHNVVKLYEEMIRKKMIIDGQWASLNSASEIEKDLFSDKDCLAGREESLDFDSDPDIIEYAPDDFSNFYNDIETKEKEITEKISDLDCKKFYRLDFSMATFPHLQVLNEAWNLSWPHESDISIPLSLHQIYHSLTKNNSSWFHYNLASLYWRRKGDIQKAIDCIKLSIHFAPRQYKDVPMLNLGVMLQKAQCSAEAAILLHAVIDHAPHKAKGHLVLANIYTSLGDYNRSIACYDNALSLKPNWGPAKKARHAIVCHNKIKNTLNNLQISIQDINHQFEELNTVQEQLVKNQEEIIFHQQTPLSTTFSTLLSHTRECLPRSSSDDQLVCDFSTENSYPPGHYPAHLDITMDSTSLQLLLSKVESQAQRISDYVPLPTFENYKHNKKSLKTEVRDKYKTLIDDNNNEDNKIDKLSLKDNEPFTKYNIK